jgi:hypothetical protein
MMNLAKFLYEIAAGVGEVAEKIDADHVSKEDNIHSGALRSHYGQLVAVADAVGPDGTVDWSAIEDRLAIDLEPEPEREPGGPAIVAGRLRLPTADGYEWHDLDTVRTVLGGAPEVSEPAYTVVGRYRDNGQAWIETIYTREPDGIEALARSVCAENNQVVQDELDLEILAVFAGEPAIVAQGEGE